MEKFDALLGPLPGPVDLRRPEQTVALIEDCREPEPDEGWQGFGRGGVRNVQRPTFLFLGRQLAIGAASHLATFSLSTRPYLGCTTLPPELAYLMAVQVRSPSFHRLPPPSTAFHRPR